MTRTRSFLAAIVALPFLAGCGDGGTGPDDVPDYWPMAVGDTWTYAPVDATWGDPVQWRIVERDGDTVTLQRPGEGSHAGTVTLVDGGRSIDLLRPGVGPVPFYRFGSTAAWVHRDPWECDDGSTWVAVHEPDPIVTPAGTFAGTLRLERRSTTPCTDAGTMIEWWAPGVGLVRWEELNFYAGGPIRFELVERGG